MRYNQLVRIAVDRCFLRSQPGLNMPCRSMRAGRVSGCKGPSWSEELDGMELHGRTGGDLEPRESAVSCTSSTRSQTPFEHLLQVWYYAGF